MRKLSAVSGTRAEPSVSASGAARAGRPRALFVSPEAPYPTIGGGALRSASVLEYLSQHYAVDAIFFAETRVPPGHIERLETICLPYHSKRPAARAFRNAARLFRNRPPLLDRFSGFGRRIADFVAGQRYDLAVIEHFWCAPYLADLRASCEKVWLNLHNIESVWHQRLAGHSSRAQAFAHQRFAKAYRALEKLWLPQFDGLLVTSRNDAEQIEGISGVSQVIVYPNALPVVPPIEKKEEDVIAFSGNLEYEPNQAALRFFINGIWPAIRYRWPALTFRIIGKNPHAVRGLLSGDVRIELIGPVDDAIACLASAKVVVAPLLTGSGTRIKILEAWAAATPVVSTSIGAEGLEFEAGHHLLIADEPAEFADRISQLLASTGKRVELGQAGRKLCQDRYTWITAWRELRTMSAKQSLENRQ